MNVIPKYTKTTLNPTTKTLKFLFDKIFEILDETNAVDDSQT